MSIRQFVDGKNGKAEKAGRVGTSGSASRTGRDVGQVREVYTKEIAKCVYEELSITDKIKVVETNKLNLIDIQTADFEVREMTISQHCMSILYDEVYHIPTERYIKNIKIDISN